MKFQLDKFHRNIGDDELLDDLKKSKNILAESNESLSFRSHNDIGKYTSSTIAARFGSWNDALAKAGIETNEEKNITDRDLFLNLEKVWATLGRQPVTRDLKKPLSKYSRHVYGERFGGYRKALMAFVNYINEDDEIEFLTVEKPKKQGAPKKRTVRNISDRMRFRILSRDGFTCQSCGASPIKERGVELHVDHILPWSKGGETVEENLETKCKQCNLGKGNAFET